MLDLLWRFCRGDQESCVLSAWGGNPTEAADGKASSEAKTNGYTSEIPSLQ